MVIMTIITIYGLLEGEWFFMENVSVATVKKKLSEYISKVEINGDRIVIKRRSKPVAALISIEDLESIESKEEKGGLSEAIGKWKGFEEISKDVDGAFASRGKDEERKVSF